MAFTEETGAGIAGANAYISTAYADTYHADRGHTAWAGVTTPITTAQKEAAIIRATDHIDRTFGVFFRGYKGTDAQGLQWPRISATSPSGYTLLYVPDALQRATAEYAIRALEYGVLTPDPPPRTPRMTLTEGSTLPAYGEADGEIALVREKVGPIETESRTHKGTTGKLPSHPAADMLLWPLLRSRNTNLVRG